MIKSETFEIKWDGDRWEINKGKNLFISTSFLSVHSLNFNFCFKDCSLNSEITTFS